jgi:DNA-binding response OmpR family regulator
MGKPRVLLVDDELSMIRILSKRLQVEGFDVEVAMDGQEALTRARADVPDLIILDLRLPKLNGDEVCRTLRNDPGYPKVPIVMFTAKAQPHEQQLGLACGANAFISKPFHVHELLEAIRSLLPSSGQPGGSSA